jgi:hypothetical protein
MRGIPLPNSPNDEKNYAISSGAIDRHVNTAISIPFTKNWKTAIKITS